jgi:hypothetical protein
MMVPAIKPFRILGLFTAEHREPFTHDMRTDSLAGRDGLEQPETENTTFP